MSTLHRKVAHLDEWRDEPTRAFQTQEPPVAARTPRKSRFSLYAGFMLVGGLAMLCAHISGYVQCNVDHHRAWLHGWNI